MKVAVLPFNAAEGARPALGRQFVNFACDTIRTATGTEEIHPVSFLTQIEGEDGARAAYVNIADTLLEGDWLKQMFDQSDVSRIVDGMISTRDAGYELRLRVHDRGVDEPRSDRTVPFEASGVFDVLRDVLNTIAGAAEIELPAELKTDLDFGTDSGDVFLKFLEGYDALLYIQQTQGRVAREFDPQPAIDLLLEASQADPDFLGSYEALIQLCRLCAQHRMGKFELIEESLKKAVALASDDFRAHFALGEVYQSVNDANRAADAYEKAVQLSPEEPALYTRLGMAQMALNMPVNAERNFRKAVEMEGEDKPTLDYLAMVLAQTNRAHDIPNLWKEQLERRPEDAQSHAKYAMSLMQAGRKEDGEKAFEEALTRASDPTLVKRYYAPHLVEKGDLDRAMDFYEDCLDVVATDVPLLLEYAQTLQKAGRDFEIPKVLRDALACNPDPDTRANILAWLIEIEQPKRVEAVEMARKKMDEGDFAGALGLIKPMRNWLADYWKMWFLMSAACNRLALQSAGSDDAGEHAREAEEAAMKLLDLFPGFEPGYAEACTAMHSQSRNEEAYNLMRFAAQKHPQSPTIFAQLALAAHWNGNREEAIGLKRQLREALGPNEELENALAEIPD
ncbi:MAG: hypothetical protein HZC36_05885 [Armatimonadetes bacterium]|nr:hypothetical protein [Armatimonadota bacterium]